MFDNNIIKAISTAADERNQLKFDTDALSALAAAIESAISDIEEQHRKVEENIASLKVGWNTPAGKSFFEKVDTNWSPEVKNFTDILETLRTMVYNAVNEYADLKEEAEKLKIV